MMAQPIPAVSAVRGTPTRMVRRRVPVMLILAVVCFAIALAAGVAAIALAVMGR
ncbi:MAG TPA: hypothetical protein VFU07_07300 [Candidatus Lumbricidophila sp.]|nr:hypothetical protein [Candidatus Lumbricidophila sp.]